MRYWILLFSIIISANAVADEPIAVLKGFCEKNQADYWVKNSESCRLVRGEYKIDQLCEGYAKGKSQHTVRLQSIADKYGELKLTDSDSALQQLCAKQIGPNAIAAKPECVEEREGKREISRKWWDGSQWTTTKENPSSVKDKADKGDKSAQFNLGVWHLDGAECVSRDTKVAAPLLCSAYDQGEKAAGLIFPPKNGVESYAANANFSYCSGVL